jgi:hypothetical protein
MPTLTGVLLELPSYRRYHDRTFPLTASAQVNSQRLAVFIGLFSLLVSQGPRASGELDINLSDDSVRVRVGQDLAGSAQGRKQYGVGMLYNTDDNAMLDLWFQITDEAGSKAPGLDLSVGPKAYFGATDTQEYLAFALGGALIYRPLSANRMVMVADGFIAPSIITFLDADNMWEINLRIGYEILPSAVAYLSYRQIRANFEVAEDEEVIDRGGQVGLDLRF